MSYRALGFTGNPFDTKALQPNDAGEMLIVGREREIGRIVRRIQDGTKMPTIEGANGIGKTSLINVATYRLLTDSLKDDTNPLFLPCRSTFQLGKDTVIDDFEDHFYLEIAQTLIENRGTLRPPRGHTKAPFEATIDQYLNSPIIRSYSASILGNGAGYTAGPNGGHGFERNGFKTAINNWLRVLFPNEDAGSVVCVLDNLELLQSSRHAKETIEVLRDRMFSVHGIRWILCGSSGIVKGVATSPRMVGWMHSPINVTEIEASEAGAIYKARIAHFRSNREAIAPATEQNFVELFNVMNGNTRFALNECDDYCNWVFDEIGATAAVPSETFDRWLNDELDTLYGDIFVNFDASEAAAFKRICQMEIFMLADHIECGIEDIFEFEQCVAKFTNLGLITCSLDMEESGSKVYELSAKSFKLQYFIDSQTGE